VHEPRGPFELTDEREERAVGVMRGAEVAQAEVRVGLEPLDERKSNMRLADTGFSRKHRNASFALNGRLPAP